MSSEDHGQNVELATTLIGVLIMKLRKGGACDSCIMAALMGSATAFALAMGCPSSEDFAAKARDVFQRAADKMNN
jgi:hypothetical protein